MKLGELILKTRVGFGTSGVRALSDDISDEIAFKYTDAFLNFIKKQYPAIKKQVALAGDRRPSTPRILNAVANAIVTNGYEVIYGGQIPTPAVSFYGFQNKIPSIMVTGSHIPFDRNGIKFNKPDGELLKDDELLLKSESIISGNIIIQDLNLSLQADIRQSYINRYLKFFPKNFLKGKLIGVYGHSSVGRDILVQLAEFFGAKVTKLNFTEEFIPIDTDAFRKEDRELCLKWSKDFKFDAIISTDGDADRPMLADNYGNLINGDLMDTLVAKYLGANKVIVPIICNTLIDLSGYFNEVIRTKVGSPYIVKELIKANSLNDGLTAMGFESNGGFLVGSDVNKFGKNLDPLLTRDAVLPLFSLFALSVEANKSISDLISELPKRFTCNSRLKDFSIEKSHQIITQLILELKNQPEVIHTNLKLSLGKCLQIDELDGLRVTLESGDIFHLRPSGNAPELRFYTESFTDLGAKKLSDLIMNRLQELR